jgi:transposase
LASESSPAVKRKLTRSKMHRFFSQIEPSFIGMEACGSAHYWARELKVKPYVKRGKNDAVDAEAIGEAASPDALCPDQECGAASHVDAAQERELLVKQRTMSVNALRSHEFGIIIARGSISAEQLHR